MYGIKTHDEQKHLELELVLFCLKHMLQLNSCQLQIAPGKVICMQVLT
jgi:hypothetical protein